MLMQIFDIFRIFNEFFFYPKGYEFFEDSIATMLGKKDKIMKHIRDFHKGGHVPIKYKAIPEGSLVNVGVPLFTVENTHIDEYPTFWLTNFVETAISSLVWHPITVATIAYQYKKLFIEYLNKTSDVDISFVNFQGHDFSARGHTHPIAAANGGQGHLTCFQGTDTVAAIAAIKEYYSPIRDDGMLIGASVPATEHSVMSAFGIDNDFPTFENLLNIYPEGIVSIVSDTWDFWYVVTTILPKLKDKILARNGKLVIRPDSGDPVKIMTGDINASSDAEKKGLIGCLLETFGYTINSKGFKVLNPKVGAIYGDSITYDIAKKILEALHIQNIDTSCVVFGIGSYTYQYVTRDTFGFAMKATWANIDGKSTDLYKKPKTDSGGKFSIKGLPLVYKKDEDYFVKQSVSYDVYNSLDNELKDVCNGSNLYRDTLANIRSRVDNQIRIDLGY
jgi:nicotinamide phosphoribosyltransferase